MSVLQHSLKIESLIQKVKGNSYRRRDEISRNPYEEIISALEYRVPSDNMDKFKLKYQATLGKNLQDLIDENYDIELLLNDIKQLIENK